MTDSIDKILQNNLIQEGYHFSGEIMRNQAGDVALIELGVLRKLDLDQMFELMHPHEPRKDKELVWDALGQHTEYGLMP